jgi:cephalosporin hydroxylase
VIIQYLKELVRKNPILRKIILPIWGFITIFDQIRIKYEIYRYSIFQEKYNIDLSFSEAVKRFSNRNLLHAYMHYYFQHLAPISIREHRKYFNNNMRGFGEDALHSMWWTLLREYKPKLTLEIGVYRGQVVTLWGVISKLNSVNCEIHGVSPFSPAGDQVSVYLSDLDYMKDTLISNRYFDLAEPKFIKAYSTDEAAIEYIKNTKWDLIYIDGNHDYEVVLADYLLCKDALADGGLLVMDDSSLYTDFKPPKFSFAGHPGPSRVVKERAMKEMHFLGGVGHNNVFTNK